VIVDCHRHVIPDGMFGTAVPADWRPVISSDNGRSVVSFRGKKLNSVTSEFANVAVMLDEAAAAGASHLLLSPWILLVPVLAELATAQRISRVLNESLAQAAQDTAGMRVFGLGAVPLQDPSAAVAELEYLMTLPGMRGIEVPASVGGSYLGDDRFWPVWEAAAGTGAMVFIHPTTTGLGIPALDGHYLWNSVGNPVETAIAAAQLIVGGVLDRFRDLSVLLAHGGGALLTLRGRLRRAYQVRAEARSDSAVAPDDLLRRFYFDSLTHDQAVLRDLVEFAGADHVLLGSDAPFDMGTDMAAAEVRALGLRARDEQLILGGNASRLLRIATDE